MKQNTPNFWGRIKPGSFVAIPLPSGGYGYGRVLDSKIAFYEIKTKELSSIEEIIKQPVIFISSVAVMAVKSKRWPVIGWKPIEPELRRDIKFFRPNLSPGAPFRIYVSKAPMGYEDYEATPEECVGLEPQMTWSPTAMEQRLDEHFAGKQTPAIERALANLRRYIQVH